MKRPRPTCNNYTHTDNKPFKPTKPFHYVASNYNPAHSFPRSLDDPSTPPHKLRQTSLWRISRKPRLVKGKLALDSSTFPCERPASRHLKLRPPTFLHRKHAPSSLPACQPDEEDPIATPVFSTPRHALRQSSFADSQNSPGTNHLPPHSLQKPSIDSAIIPESVSPHRRLITNQRNRSSSPTPQRNGLRSNLYERAHASHGDYDPRVLFQAYASDSDESSHSLRETSQPSRLQPADKHQVVSNQRTPKPSKSQLFIPDLEENVSSPSSKKHKRHYPSTVPNRSDSCSHACPPRSQHYHCAPIARTSHIPQTKPACAATPPHCIRRLAQPLAPASFQTPHPEQMHPHQQEPDCVPISRSVRSEWTPQAYPSELGAIRTRNTPQSHVVSFRLPWDSPLEPDPAIFDRYMQETPDGSKSTPEILHEQVVAEENTGERRAAQPLSADRAACVQWAEGHAEKSLGADLIVSDGVAIERKIDRDSDGRKKECSVRVQCKKLTDVLETPLAAVKKIDHYENATQRNLLRDSLCKATPYVLKIQSEWNESEMVEEMSCTGCKFGHYSSCKDGAVVASLEMEPVIVATHSQTIHVSSLSLTRQLAEIRNAEKEGEQVLAGHSSIGGKEHCDCQTRQDERSKLGEERQNSGSQVSLQDGRASQEKCSNDTFSTGRAKVSPPRMKPVTTAHSMGIRAQGSCTQLEKSDLEKGGIQQKFATNDNEGMLTRGAEVSGEARKQARSPQQEEQEQDRDENLVENNNTRQKEDCEDCAAEVWNHGARREKLRSGTASLQKSDSSAARSNQIAQQDEQASHVLLPRSQGNDIVDIDEGINAVCVACDSPSVRTSPQRLVTVRNSMWFQKVLGEVEFASPETQSIVRWEKSARPAVDTARNAFRRARSPARILRVMTSESCGSSTEECGRASERGVEECGQVEAEEVQNVELDLGGTEGMVSMEEDDVCWDAGNLCTSLPRRRGTNIDDKDEGNRMYMEQGEKEHSENAEEDRMTESPSQGEEEEVESDGNIMRNEMEMECQGVGVLCRPLLVRIAAGALRSPSTPASSDDEQIRVV